jgi:proteasome lid subunit RPN8/RPN11/molybdopterin converting factor small subunit
VLKIAREHVDAMIAHAREDHPDEACGVIVGSEGTDVPTRLVRMINADRSPTFFRFDPQEQFELYKTMSAAGEEIVVVYHSHTSTEAYPSRTDITLASEPQAHYVRLGCRGWPGQCALLPHCRWCGHRGGDRGHGIGLEGQSFGKRSQASFLALLAHPPLAVRNRGEKSMSVEVRIPTILRTFTGGAKAVHGNGATLQQVLDDIEARNPGLKDRIVEAETLRRFVNVYVNDEDVRFTGGLNAPTADGDVVVVLPAVAGG